MCLPLKKPNQTALPNSNQAIKTLMTHQPHSNYDMAFNHSSETARAWVSSTAHAQASDWEWDVLLRLEVAVHHAQRVQMVQRQRQLRQVKLHIVLREHDLPRTPAHFTERHLRDASSH